MTNEEFCDLRGRCIALVKQKLKEKYDKDFLDDFITLSLIHLNLPSMPLVIDTYKGIIGYYK